MKKLKWLEHIGLCEGVRNAIWSTISSVEPHKKVIIFGNLIHNQRVQQELSWNGIQTMYELEDIPSNARVIIPAHGITKTTEALLRQKVPDIIDRTCPVVIKLRRLLMSVIKHHDFAILVGKKNHPEIVGAVSYVPSEKIIIVESLKQIKTLNLPRGPIALLSQTTSSRIVFDQIHAYLEQVYPPECLSVFETICPTVSKRQEDAVAFAKQSDMVFVVGDSKSSNTYSLYELAEKENSHTYLVQSDEDHHPVPTQEQEYIQKINSLAILSGTSSPTYIIDETVHQICTFLNMRQEHKPVLVIYGPTAIGKSDLAEQIALQYNGEIINVDSMQIYKHLTIGTAKPTLTNSQLQYHLVDHVDPREHYSVARFRKEAIASIKSIQTRNRMPILAGGSNLYLSSIIDGLFEHEKSSDPLLRMKLKEQVKNKGLDSLYEELSTKDPECAKKIHPNDEKRIIRAMEVIYLTNKKMSEWQHKETHAFPCFFIKIGLVEPLEQLYQRINLRVDKMIKSGLLQEVEWLNDYGYAPHIERIKAHGYRELMSAYHREISLEEALEKMKKNTRNYAKRQLSWLRQRSDFHLLNTSVKSSQEWAKIIMNIYDIIEKKLAQ